MANLYKLPSKAVMQERAQQVANRFPGDMREEYVKFLLSHHQEEQEIEVGAPLVILATIANDFLQIGNRLAGHTVTIMYRSQINGLFPDASQEWKDEAIALFAS